MNKKAVWILVAVVVVIAVIIVIVVVGGNHGASAPVTQNGNGATQPGQNGQQQAPVNMPGTGVLFAATANGFSVNFPGAPTVASKSFKSPSAGSISETDYTYISSANGKGVLYMIMVLHYPATYKFPSNYLTGALQMFSTIINAKYPGTTVSAQPQSQFLGGPAISAAVTVPFMGTPTPGNVLITTKNQNTYVVSAYGLSQSDYTAFLNSFTFTQ
jgi:hypothetical protein